MEMDLLLKTALFSDTLGNDNPGEGDRSVTHHISTVPSDLPDPLGTFLQRLESDALSKGSAGVTPFSWDQPITATAPIVKRGTPVTFAKGSR